MSDRTPTALNELFHQPVRLRIMAEVCAAAKGVAFVDLRERCNATDGNLSRHLQALQGHGAVKMKKSFVNARPMTMVVVTGKGREAFLEYLVVLERVLKDTVERVGQPKLGNKAMRGLVTRAV